MSASDLHYQQAFGIKNKPRNEEPDMFQMLTWEVPKDSPWDFKKKTIPSNNPSLIKCQKKI